MESCRDCRFRVAGSCRRNPPASTYETANAKAGTTTIRVTPVQVPDDWWCGEWKPRLE